MIKSYTHLEAVKITVSIGNKISSGLVEVVYPDSDKNIQLYSGKKFVITYHTTQTNVTLYIGKDNKKYLHSIANIFDTSIVGETIDLFVSFNTLDDNQALTFADIIKRFTNISDGVVVNGIAMQSTPMFLDETNRTKLSLLKTRLKSTLTVTSNGTIFPVGVIRKNSTGSHQFELVSNNNIVHFTLLYNMNGWTLKMDNNTTNKRIAVNIVAGFIDGVEYVGFNLAFIGVANTDVYTVYHYVTTESDLINNNPLNILTNTTTLSYVDEDPKRYGQQQQTLTFCKYTKEISNNGIQTALYRNEQLPLVTTLSESYMDGKYNYNHETISATNVTDLPTGVTKQFYVTTKLLSKTANSYVINQVLYTTNNDNKVVSYSRLLRNTTNTNWEFYNQSLFWRDAVESVTNLPTANAVNGWIAYVKDEAILYKYNGQSWTKLYGNASSAGDGLLSKELFDEHFIKSSISKRVSEELNSYIHRRSDFNFLQVGDNVLDFVYRTNTTPMILESNTINFGTNITNSLGGVAVGRTLLLNGTDNVLFGINMDNNNNATNNSIMFGSSLTTGSDSQTIIGHHNENSAVNAFEVGGGTELTKANIFAVKRDGVAVCNGFATTNGTSDYLLTADGSMIHINDVGKTPAFRREEYTNTYDGVSNIFEISESVHSIELPVFVNGTPIFGTDVLFNSVNKTVTITADLLYEGDIVTVYGIIPDETVTDPMIVVDSNSLVDGIFEITLNHNGKSILVTANNAILEVKTTLPNQFKVDIDFAISTGKMRNSAGATGNFYPDPNNTNTHTVAPNGQIKVYKVSNVTRIVGDFI